METILIIWYQAFLFIIIVMGVLFMIFFAMVAVTFIGNLVLDWLDSKTE